MDNHIFRSSIGGFNRQDVMEYIEKTQKESSETVAQLEEQVRQLQQESDGLRASLDSCTQERDALASELEEVTGRCDTARANWESQAVISEGLRGDVAQRDAAIREMTAENQKLFHRVQALEEELAVLRLEKEKVAQLELEAHKRSEEVVASARARADELLADAQRQAQSVGEEAAAQAQQLRRETAEQLQGAVERCHELIGSFGSIASHVSGELRKMDVTAAQLPICFDHVTGGLDAVMEKIRGE